MIHCVQFSTGIGSAEVAVRVQDIAKDEDRLVLLTADTMVEDEDNWRFAKEVVDYLSPRWEWIIIRDGRTPMQVGRDRKVVPSDRMAVCSQILKRDALNKWIKHNCDPEDSIIYLGFDWTEPHRHHRAEPLWLPYKIDSPLMREPYTEKPALLDKYRAMGITPPVYTQSDSAMPTVVVPASEEVKLHGRCCWTGIDQGSLNGNPKKRKADNCYPKMWPCSKKLFKERCTH